MNVKFLGIAPATFLATTLIAGRALAADVDVAIVFAVDVSGSVDPFTADLQREGHALALRSPQVIAAIAGNHFGCIAIAYFEWSSREELRTVLPWTGVCGAEDALAAAKIISERGDRGNERWGGGETSISYAIDTASSLLDDFAGQVGRKVIDISSNGRNNSGLPVAVSRARAIAKGYTINAIAIPTEHRGVPDRHSGVPDHLVNYFAQEVIGGPSAFVLEPVSREDYAVALRRKLTREISHHIGANSRSLTD
jgi:hypothetical protein